MKEHPWCFWDEIHVGKAECDEKTASVEFMLIEGQLCDLIFN